MTWSSSLTGKSCDLENPLKELHKEMTLYWDCQFPQHGLHKSSLTVYSFSSHRTAWERSQRFKELLHYQSLSEKDQQWTTFLNFFFLLSKVTSFRFSAMCFNKTKFNPDKQAKFHLPASSCKVLDTRIFKNIINKTKY